MSSEAKKVPEYDKITKKGYVSIIITTCRRDMPVLERALRSAEKQTYSLCNIIVVNDYPPYEEQIRDMLKDHPDVILICNDVQSGACISRNSGINAANGEFIALLDDDDIWKPDKIEKQISAMKSGADLVYCDYEAHRGSEVLRSDEERSFPEGNVVRDILGSNFIGGCSIPLIKHETILKCGGFDPVFRSCQDLDMWIRIAKIGKVSCVREKLSVYMVGNESITGSFDKRLQGWNKILDKYSEDYRKYPDSFKRFTGTMVREAAKRQRLSEAFKLAVKYGRFYDMINGLGQRILKIY